MSDEEEPKPPKPPPNRVVKEDNFSHVLFGCVFFGIFVGAAIICGFDTVNKVYRDPTTCNHLNSRASHSEYGYVYNDICIDGVIYLFINGDNTGYMAVKFDINSNVVLCDDH